MSNKYEANIRLLRANKAFSQGGGPLFDMMYIEEDVSECMSFLFNMSYIGVWGVWGSLPLLAGPSPPTSPMRTCWLVLLKGLSC